MKIENEEKSKIVLIPESDAKKILLLVPLLAIGVIILRCAWTCDDAYISFRTIYNFTHGYGLSFNINERVQSFTDPLWVLLLSIPYYFTNEAYFTSIVAGTLVSLVTYYLILKRTIVNGDFISTILITGLIISSKALMDFSTSGLENPLSNLLYVIFFVILFRDKGDNYQKFRNLAFVSSLSSVNRLDTILFFIPILLFEFIKLRDRKAIKMGIVGFLPLIGWEIFSILYYGFPFPNTYYTKLNTGLPSSFYLNQGVDYYINSLSLDPITLSTIFLVLLIVLSAFYKNGKMVALALGIILYMFYVLKIGGDFMSGRFFTIAFCAALCIVSQIRITSQIQYLALLLVGLLSLGNPYSPIYSHSKYRKEEAEKDLFTDIVQNYGISDERAAYYSGSGLLLYSPTLYNAKIENVLKSFPDSTVAITEMKQAVVMLGYEGYQTPPNVYVFHHMALSDALLGRLPILDAPSLNWRIGHYYRRIPSGYLASLMTHSNYLADPLLKAYYDKLLLLTRGPILSWERLATIYNMNAGKYDSLIDRDKYKDLSFVFNAIDFTSLLENLKPDPISTVAFSRLVTPSSVGSNEYIVWGPYTQLPGGKYKASFSLKINDNQSEEPIAELDVFSFSQNSQIAKLIVTGRDFQNNNQFQEFDLPFDLPFDMIDVEFRIKYFKKGDLSFDYVKLRPQ